MYNIWHGNIFNIRLAKRLLSGATKQTNEHKQVLLGRDWEDGNKKLDFFVLTSLLAEINQTLLCHYKLIVSNSSLQTFQL